MDQKELQKRLMSGFLVELGEHVQAMNQALLAMEKVTAPEDATAHVDALFRVAHTLKSASRAVGLGALETAAHRMEGIISQVRGGTLERSPRLFEILFEFVDGFHAAEERLRTGQTISATFFDRILDRLGEFDVAPEPRAEGSGPVLSPPLPKTRRVVSQEPPLEIARGSVRVSSTRLDEILSMSTELGQRVVRVGESLPGFDALQDLADRGGGERGLRRGLARARAGLRADLASVFLALEQLEEEVQRLRMFPFLTACQGLDRMTRDLERQVGREVDLVISGEDVELDRTVLEGLKDPLSHLVRNAVGHGIEPAAVRVAAGKPARGTIQISASLQRGLVQVDVSDDGKGIDLDAVRLAAKRRGMDTGGDADALLRLLYLPGFTTAGTATVLAGRGVGLDVVMTRIEALQGTIRMRSERCVGTTISMMLPLTLTTVNALLVEDRTVCYAIPSAHVERVLRVAPGDIHVSSGRAVMHVDDAALPVAPLSSMLDGCALGTMGEEQWQPGVVLMAQERRAVLVVDRLLDTRDVMVRPLSPRLGRVRHMSGVATLPDGRVAPILYAPGLLDALSGRDPGGSWVPPREETRDELRARLLLVDDSLTTRSLERMILESAGYKVITAGDGAEAWEILQRTTVDLVVTDVQMPRMDGFGLTSTIRSSKTLMDLPVVLVTGLGSEEDRRRGLDAGANAYIVKGAFDQGELLETVARLL